MMRNGITQIHLRDFEYTSLSDWTIRLNMRYLSSEVTYVYDLVREIQGHTRERFFPQF